MFGVLTVEQAELLATKFYGEDEPYSIQYAEGVSGEEVCLFDDDRVQEFYDNKIGGSEIYNHLIAVIPNEEDEEDKWLCIIIVESIDRKNILAIMTPWEDHDTIIQYELWEA